MQNIRTELMVMLTWKDKTVSDAYEIFESCKYLPVFDWGFKNAGMTDASTAKLIAAMKSAGKQTYYEIITRTKEAYIAGEATAEKAMFDCMMGTKYDQDLHDKLKSLGITFCPALGKPGSVYNGVPGVLLGDYDEIIDEGKMIVSEKGVDGITIPVFRYYQDGTKLLDMLLNALPDTPIYVAGSVDSLEKMDLMFSLGIAKFTMGSALFNKKYVPNGTFRDNLEFVANYLEQKHPRK